LSRILLVRHGETELQSSLRYWGKTDVSLQATGLSQARKLCQRLATEKIDCIYSSELKRAYDTACIVANNHNLGVTICPELKEIDFGKLEGFNFAEIQTQFPEVVRMWNNRSPSLAYPGGESLTELESRVARFKTRLADHQAGDTILVVAHAGVLRTLICQLLELEMKSFWNIKLDLASLSIVETYPEVNILCLLNDVSHLTEKNRV
jgi:alpha-ribazole phosphatase